jgi:heme o synthase
MLGSGARPEYKLLLLTIIGTALVMASGCVFNNYLDRGIDGKMKRTQKRATVTGDITAVNVFVFGALLAFCGLAILYVYTNSKVVLLGLIALFIYVVAYGVAKRRSVHGTLVGTIPGALPPVAGYVAASASFDSGALILFLILVFWQMPHFYAIAIFRMDDYRKAGIPVMPLRRGIMATKIQMVLYILAFMCAVAALTALAYTGYIFLIVMLGLGLLWLLRSLRDGDENVWARGMFIFSLYLLPMLSTLLTLNPILP